MFPSEEDRWLEAQPQFTQPSRLDRVAGATMVSAITHLSEALMQPPMIWLMLARIAFETRKLYPEVYDWFYKGPPNGVMETKWDEIVVDLARAHFEQALQIYVKGGRAHEPG